MAWVSKRVFSHSQPFFPSPRHSARWPHLFLLLSVWGWDPASFTAAPDHGDSIKLTGHHNPFPSLSLITPQLAIGYGMQSRDMDSISILSRSTSRLPQWDCSTRSFISRAGQGVRGCCHGAEPGQLPNMPLSVSC